MRRFLKGESMKKKSIPAVSITRQIDRLPNIRGFLTDMKNLGAQITVENETTVIKWPKKRKA